jgi:hypothetical protein
MMMMMMMTMIKMTSNYLATLHCVLKLPQNISDAAQNEKNANILHFSTSRILPSTSLLHSHIALSHGRN